MYLLGLFKLPQFYFSTVNSILKYSFFLFPVWRTNSHNCLSRSDVSERKTTRIRIGCHGTAKLWRCNKIESNGAAPQPIVLHGSGTKLWLCYIIIGSIISIIIATATDDNWNCRRTEYLQNCCKFTKWTTKQLTAFSVLPLCA